MATWTKVHNMRALLHIGEEVAFHSATAIAAIDRTTEAPDASDVWVNLYALAAHAACAGAFLNASLPRRNAVKVEFPGREPAFRLYTGATEDLDSIKLVRDAMIHADERFEAEWMRLESLGQETTMLRMRAVGRLPASCATLINWDPNQLTVSGRVGMSDTQREVKYSSVSLTELRRQLTNLQVGSARFEERVGRMFPPRPGPNDGSDG
jgi:hypothetical protein